jgi:hypothetical protein
VFENRKQAERSAAKEAERCAKREAKNRGASGDLHVHSSAIPDIAETATGTIYLGTRVVATAAGRIDYETLC